MKGIKPLYVLLEMSLYKLYYNENRHVSFSFILFYITQILKAQIHVSDVY